MKGFNWRGVRGRIVSSTPESDADYAVLAEDRSSPKVDFRTLAKRIIMTLLALLILPYLLIPVYALPFIRPVSTLMLADLVTLQGYDRRWVPLEDISPRLVQSVMMSEDGQFCFHGGVDWNQMQSVVSNALDGAATRGASTIPMQTAKNLFLWNGRSFLRKALELPLAIAADFVWSKADDGDLSQRRRMGTGYLRHRGCRPAPFQGAGRQAQFPTGRTSGRFASQSH